MTEHNQEHELELIKKAQLGDSKAVEVLVVLYENDIQRWAQKIFRKYRDYYGNNGWDDIAQELSRFVIEKSLPRYTSHNNVPFVAWVITGWKQYFFLHPPRQKTAMPISQISDGNITDPIDPKQGSLDSIIARDELEVKVFSPFHLTDTHDKLAIREFFESTDNVFLRRKGLALIEMSTAQLFDEDVTQTHLNSSVRYRRSLLERLAGISDKVVSA